MTVFISRELKPGSPLRAWATATGNTVVSRSYLTFAPVAFVPPADADWWFFYSPRAVAFALRGGLPPPETKLAAMGPGTAAELENMGRHVDFTGDGHPARTAAAFREVCAGERIFFPRARQSRLSVQSALENEITVLDAVVYDNRPAPASAPVNADVFVFTSPLNVAAYLDHQPLPARARVVAIGPSTGAALRERGIKCDWPEEASEEGIVELL